MPLRRRICCLYFFAERRDDFRAVAVALFDLERDKVRLDAFADAFLIRVGRVAADSMVLRRTMVWREEFLVVERFFIKCSLKLANARYLHKSGVLLR